jgi:pentachlorophenol monooxygenase
MRLFSLLGRRDHTLLLYAGHDASAADVASFERAAQTAVTAARGRIEVYLLAAPRADVGATVLPLIRDSAGEFARLYGADGPAVFVVRPDGYLSFSSSGIDTDGVAAHLAYTFGTSVSASATPALR